MEARAGGPWLGFTLSIKNSTMRLERWPFVILYSMANSGTQPALINSKCISLPNLLWYYNCYKFVFPIRQAALSPHKKTVHYKKYPYQQMYKS